MSTTTINWNACINEDRLQSLTESELRALNRMLNNGHPRLYSYETVDTLIDLYRDRGGEYLQISEGTLGSGDWILYGDGLKTTIIKETPVNCWSSEHKIRKYNKTPKKYQVIIDAYENGDIDWDYESFQAIWVATGKPVII